MSDMTYEQALKAALYPLRDYIFVVGESDGQLNHKAIGAFFSKEEAHDFLENQKSLYPDKIFFTTRDFGLLVQRLLDERDEFLEKVKSLAEDLEEKK